LGFTPNFFPLFWRGAIFSRGLGPGLVREGLIFKGNWGGQEREGKGFVPRGRKGFSSLALRKVGEELGARFSFSSTLRWLFWGLPGRPVEGRRSLKEFLILELVNSPGKKVFWFPFPFPKRG